MPLFCILFSPVGDLPECVVVAVEEVTHPSPTELEKKVLVF
jgi:hypothetical protein